MIIEDNIENFKTFLEHASCKGLFGPTLSEFIDGSITIRSRSISGGNVVESKYTPKSVKIDPSLNRAKGTKTEYKDGWFWFEPAELLAKIKVMKSGPMTLEFNGETIDIKCGKVRRKTMNVGLTGAKYDLVQERKANDIYSAKFVDGKTVFMDAEIHLHSPSVGVINLKEISETKKSISNASTYLFKVSDAGEFDIIVADSDKVESEYMETRIDEIKDVKAGFTVKYNSGFDEAIHVFDGFVDLWFGDSVPLIVKHTTTDKNRNKVVETMVICAPVLLQEKKDEYNADGSVVDDNEFQEPDEEPGEEGEEINPDE